MSLRSEPKFKLLLVRHGETDSNKEMRFVGRGDYPLNDTGRQQVETTAQKLIGRSIDHFYSSPASRAFETATILNQKIGAPLTKHDALWELDFNRWEGMTIQEIMQSDPEGWRSFFELRDDAPHGGETLEDAAIRGREWINHIHAAHPEHAERPLTIGVASHGGFLQTLLCELLGTSKRTFWPYRFQNAALAEVWVYPLGSTLISFG